MGNSSRTGNVRRKYSSYSSAQSMFNRSSKKGKKVIIDNKRWIRFLQFFEDECNKEDLKSKVDWFKVVHDARKSLDPSKSFHYQHEMHHLHKVAYEEPANSHFVHLSFMESKLNEIFLRKETELELTHKSFMRNKTSFENHDVLKNLETGEGFRVSIRPSLEGEAEENFARKAIQCFKFNKESVPNPAIQYNIIFNILKVLKTHLKKKNFIIRKLMTKFFTTHLQEKVSAVKEKFRLIENPDVTSMADDLEQEEKMKSSVDNIINDISTFAIFLSDLTIHFYNLDRIEYQGVSRVGEPMANLHCVYVDIKFFFNYYIEYFLNEGTYSVIFELLQERYSFDESIFMRNFLELSNTNPMELGIPSDFLPNVDDNSRIGHTIRGKSRDESMIMDEKLCEMLASNGNLSFSDSQQTMNIANNLGDKFKNVDYQIEEVNEDDREEQNDFQVTIRKMRSQQDRIIDRFENNLSRPGSFMTQGNALTQFNDPKMRSSTKKNDNDSNRNTIRLPKNIKQVQGNIFSPFNEPEIGDFRQQHFFDFKVSKTDFLAAPARILSSIDSIRSPLSKIQIILQALTMSLEELRMLNSSQKRPREAFLTVTLDNLMSLLIYLIIKGRISGILVHSRIIQIFSKTVQGSNLRIIAFLLKGAIRYINKISTSKSICSLAERKSEIVGRFSKSLLRNYSFGNTDMIKNNIEYVDKDFTIGDLH